MHAFLRFLREIYIFFNFFSLHLIFQCATFLFLLQVHICYGLEDYRNTGGRADGLTDRGTGGHRGSLRTGEFMCENCKMIYFRDRHSVTCGKNGQALAFYNAMLECRAPL